jgi:serine/threonine protein kinase
MPRLKESISLETAFGSYAVSELIGEGAAGRVYGGVGTDGAPIALKVLSSERASADRRRRFKNEIAFLTRNRHPNIVTVVDHGVAHARNILGSFYVMRRYHKNLRDLMREGIAPGDVLRLFGKILDGVEAAHLQGAVHRDLKPENILYDRDANAPAVADFGIASFTEDLLATHVSTSPAQRLANFQYAAPEQRTPGKHVRVPADIYALGLILNEMFTGSVPHGTGYRLISQISEALAFLDEVVSKMLRQTPEERPASIADLKGLLQAHESEAISLQRLSKISGAVIKCDEIDEPLAYDPPRLVGFDWNDGTLTLTLDRPVTQYWISALRQMGSFGAAMGRGPETFSFRGNQAVTESQEQEIQHVINHFKGWLPQATQTLKFLLEQKIQREAAERREQLRREQQAEEQRLRILRNVKI